MQYKEKTERIIKAFYKVYNELGFGFLERVYEKALFIELENVGFLVESQKELNVFYFGEKVGKYFADLVVDGVVILELKAASKLTNEHELQLINYLKATNIEIGLLLNFGEKPEIRRKVFSNSNK